MKVKDLLKLIPEEELAFLAAESRVDHQVKKLDGVTIFQLILFSMVNSEKASLRIMESMYHSMQFRMVAGLDNQTTKFNSIRDRIATIDSSFFEKVFHSLFDRFSGYLQERDAIVRYDSTMVTVSSALVDWGMKVEKKSSKVQLKYTVGMKGSLPCSVSVYDTQGYASEDRALGESILSDPASQTGTVVFDRGIQSRKRLADFTKEGRRFVTRANANVRYRTVRVLAVTMEPKGTLVFEEDLIVHLRDASQKWVETEIRLVKARTSETGEPIYFLTNIMDMTAVEVAATYRQRWEIEVFFRFLKQNLNLGHLTARNRNGIGVMVYMTLILSILLIVYKKLNNIAGYKIARFRFLLDLEEETTKQIVILCGGDPDKAPHLWSSG